MSKTLRFGLEVIDDLNGPRNCRDVIIEHKTGHTPTITYVCLITDPKQLDAITEILVKYKMIKRKVKIK